MSDLVSDFGLREAALVGVDGTTVNAATDLRGLAYEEVGMDEGGLLLDSFLGLLIRRDDRLSCFVGDLGAAFVMVAGGASDPAPVPARSAIPSSSPVSQSRGGLILATTGEDGDRR